LEEALDLSSDRLLDDDDDDDRSGTCAKAVCSRPSQRQHGVARQVKSCGCDCPSKMRKIQFSNFQTLKTIEDFANVYISCN